MIKDHWDFSKTSIIESLITLMVIVLGFNQGCSNRSDIDPLQDRNNEMPADVDAGNTNNDNIKESCGNGIIDNILGEQCDGSEFGGESCQSLGEGKGTLICDPVICTFDFSMCVPDSPADSPPRRSARRRWPPAHSGR